MQVKMSGNYAGIETHDYHFESREVTVENPWTHPLNEDFPRMDISLQEGQWCEKFANEESYPSTVYILHCHGVALFINGFCIVIFPIE